MLAWGLAAFWFVVHNVIAAVCACLPALSLHTVYGKNRVRKFTLRCKGGKALYGANVAACPKECLYRCCMHRNFGAGLKAALVGLIHPT